MKAADVMVRHVITMRPDDNVADAVKLLTANDISAVPVVDDHGAVVGVLSEADLIHRAEIGTEKRYAWWLEAVMPAWRLAGEFTKAHGRSVKEVMSSDPITASENASLGEIAMLLERHRIKRIPIVRDGKLVGIVSRSNLIQALASSEAHAESGTVSDRKIRSDILDRLGAQKWTDFGDRNVIVSNGVVHLWGLVGSPAERQALLALAESVPGVVSVSDEMIPAY